MGWAERLTGWLRRERSFARGRVKRHVAGLQLSQCLLGQASARVVVGRRVLRGTSRSVLWTHLQRSRFRAIQQLSAC